MAKRIAELAKREERIARAGLEDTIADLMAMAEVGDTVKSAASLKEARLARLEANRLWRELAKGEEEAPLWSDRELTQAEWDARFGPSAPGGF